MMNPMMSKIVDHRGGHHGDRNVNSPDVICGGVILSLCSSCAMLLILPVAVLFRG